MSDPFHILGVDGDIQPAGLARAYAQALKRGVPAGVARRAMDALRDPVVREASALLAPSQTPAFQRLQAAATSESPADEALGLLWDLLAVIVADTERMLSSPPALPPIRIPRDVRDYVPPPFEELMP